jgi:hypothetical protein
MDEKLEQLRSLPWAKALQFFEEMKEGGYRPEPLANGYGFTGCDFVV